MTVPVIRRAAAAAVAATLLLAAPALAHPFFDPDEVPADSLASVVLDLAHGCDADDHEEDGGDAGGDEAATREVAVEVPEAATFVDPGEPEGWELTVEGGEGEPEVLVYTADDGTEDPAPQFDLDVVLAGEAGDEVDWRVVQACDGTTHRWVGTPDEPAEDPAVRLTLAEPDGDAPPPDEAGEAGSVTVTGDEEEVPTGSDDDPADDDPADDDPVADDPVADEPAVDPVDEGGMPGWLLIVVLVATLGIAGVVLSLRGSDEGPDGTPGRGDAPTGGGAGGQ